MFAFLSFLSYVLFLWLVFIHSVRIDVPDDIDYVGW